MQSSFDLVIIGGGINGTAIARDAAGRGLSVLLCEKDDLASHTSSSSTKLIHGGLRYLEHYEFRLVRESLKEREVLLRSAPHIIWPMRFVLPYDKGLRPKWMLRAGLFLYDSLGGRKLLPGTTTVNLHDGRNKGVLEERLKTGFEYSDCWVEDARLVVLNAVDAAKHGAVIKTRTRLTNITGHDVGYAATLIDEAGTETIVTARAAINAAGPWVEEILLNLQDSDEPSNLRLVKGSHIVTRKLFDGEQAYIFQNADNRIIFAIPYERDFTLIGTTDVAHANPGDEPMASLDEIAYLCGAANDYLKHDISPDDVVWSYSGVRPLYDDKSANASAVTRDYVLDIDEFSQGRPFLSVYGGKITTSRKLAEHVLEKLEPYFDEMGADWTRGAALPGGDIDGADFDGFFEKTAQAYPNFTPSSLRRLCRAYGTKVEALLAGKNIDADMGQFFGAGLSEAEAMYLAESEFAASADDILWRRSKLGLHMSETERAQFKDWFDSL